MSDILIAVREALYSSVCTIRVYVQYKHMQIVH